MTSADAEHQITHLFRERLRLAPSRWSVPGSLPVLFFGDIFTARVATVGLNPSKFEYTDASGVLLSASAQRFATLPSLGVSSRASLTDAQCDEAIQWMLSYFDVGRPVYSPYFRTLANFLTGWGGDFRARTAVHLDLVQEATSPVWSGLSRPQRESLLADGLPFLAQQIATFPFDVIFCTGRTVSERVRALLDVATAREGLLDHQEWWAGHARLDGRRVAVAGWNHPLHQPYGLGGDGQRQLAHLLRRALAT